MDTPGSHGELPVDRARRLHHEIVQLIVLVAVAIGGFFGTRAVAANNRETSIRDAAEWFRRGQEAISSGRLDEGINNLRRATVRNRGNTQYVLALAHALALRGDTDAARAALTSLRESAPEDPEINLQLARLAAARGDVDEALRFYHNTLYAPWPVGQIEPRRAVRVELVRFLLGQHQTSRALAELLALATDMPDDPGHHLEVARLFARAGDQAHALEHFERALRSDPDNGDAAAGAGDAAFQLGQYAAARGYLRRAPADRDDVARERAIVDAVLTRDPFAARIGAAERRRRLVADVDDVRQRWDACLIEHSPASDEDLALQRDVAQFSDDLAKTHPLEQDTIEAGVDLIGRVEQHVAARCGPATPFDAAMQVIGRRHGADTP